MQTPRERRRARETRHAPDVARAVTRRQAHLADDMLRAAYIVAGQRARRRPSMYDLTTAIEEAAVAEFGAQRQGQTEAPWEAGLDSIGIGTTGSIARRLGELGLWP